MFALFRTYFGRFVALFVLGCLFTVGRVVCELELPNLMSDIIDDGVLSGNIALIVSLGTTMLVWALFAMAFDIAGNLVAARTSMGFGRDLRSAVYARVSAFSLREIDGFGTSSLITRTTNDIQQLERFVQMCMTMAMMSPIMLVGAAVMALRKSVELSGIVFAAIPVLVALIAIVVVTAMPLLRSLQRKIDKLNLVTREGLTGIRVIRAYRKEAYEEGRFSEANADLAETNVTVARRMSLLMPLSALLLNAATVLIVWFGAQLIDVGSFQVGDLMAIIQYAMQVLFSAMMTSAIFMILPRSMAAAERIQQVVTTEPSIKDPKRAAQLPRTARPRGVRFEHVEFRFPGAEAPALIDVDLELAPGKTYALIGSTGSGKTTLVNLLERFYDPTSGRVLIDGVDISTLRLADLRREIACVPQKTTLFTGTIAENIAYGNPDASERDIERAAKYADAYDFIMAKEDGFATKITQAGGGLSGGQKQRVAIARALAKPCGLYVFDDSFSALDFATDARVRANLGEATQNATVLVVAQRIAAALSADQVIVLDCGRIAGVGTHDELLSTSEVYREIVASQVDEKKVG